MCVATRPMFTAKELTELRVGDEIDTGALVFEGLTNAESVILVVSHRRKKKLVEFDLIYFGINIGTWIAQVQESGKVVWVDQNRSRAEKIAKGKSTGKKKMGGKRARRYH